MTAALRVINHRDTAFNARAKPIPPDVNRDELRAFLKDWKEQDGGCFFKGHFINHASIKAFLSAGR